MAQKYWIVICSLLSLAPIGSWANTVVRYQGIAKSKDTIAYIEKHEVEYDDQKRLISAKTRYENPDGRLIADLNSDFSKSLTVPDHHIQDYRTGETQGLRRSGSDVILYAKETGKDEQTRLLTAGDAEDRILVGCQGLNYYLLGNLDSLDPDKKLPLRFLIPGKLDYYDFDMAEVSEPKSEIAEFEIKINHWFLRIFAPSLRVRYDRKLKRIVGYEGISNIKNDNGKNQTVVIEYNYEIGNSS